MGKLDGKVAFITGGGRGQGRSHALTLARMGANVVVTDICEDLPTVPYPMSSIDDLHMTQKLVEETGRRCLAVKADSRSTEDLDRAVAECMSEFGRLDVLCVNAGVLSIAENTWSLTDAQWDECVDMNLTGGFKTCRAAVPEMIRAGNGGSIVITGSVGGLKAVNSITHYNAAKHGLIGLTLTLARELAQYSIRCNIIHPTGVVSGMTQNDYLKTWADANPDLAHTMTTNALPIDIADPQDMSNAVAWLACDDSRLVTGVSLPVDGGFLLRPVPGMG